MASWSAALKDLSEGCTSWRAAWNDENDFLEADHGEETEGKREWVPGEEPFAFTRGEEAVPYVPTEEDIAATDWQED